MLRILLHECPFEYLILDKVVYCFSSLMNSEDFEKVALLVGDVVVCGKSREG